MEQMEAVLKVIVIVFIARQKEAAEVVENVVLKVNKE